MEGILKGADLAVERFSLSSAGMSERASKRERGRWRRDSVEARGSDLEVELAARDELIEGLCQDVIELRRSREQGEKLLEKLFTRVGSLERTLRQLTGAAEDPSAPSPASAPTTSSPLPGDAVTGPPDPSSPSETSGDFRAQLEELDLVLEAIEQATSALLQSQGLPAHPDEERGGHGG